MVVIIIESTIHLIRQVLFFTRTKLQRICRVSASNQNDQEKYQWTFATHSRAFQDLIQTNWLWAQSVEQRPFQIPAPLTARLRWCLGVVFRAHFGVAQRREKIEPLSNWLVPLLAPGWVNVVVLCARRRNIFRTSMCQRACYRMRGSLSLTAAILDDDLQPAGFLPSSAQQRHWPQIAGPAQSFSS